MMSGIEYTHPKFMDVTFIAQQCGVYSGEFKFKAIWMVRGRLLGVTTKHVVTLEKAREFVRVLK